MVATWGPVSAQELTGWIRGKREDMCDLAQALVEIESPTGDPRGIDRALDRVAHELVAMDYRVRVVGGGETNHLLAAPADRDKGQPIQLLIGHIDTVWPQGTLATMPFRSDQRRLYGPGVLDMKGGLVQMLFALRALRDLAIGLAATPVVFINSDEETGSRDSTRHLVRLGQAASRAFVLEPADGPTGALKTARKGVGRFRVAVRGRAAHAGLSPGDGASAILEMSHLVQRLFELNAPDRGVTVNVGTIDGGLGANVVAPRVVAEVDVRTWTEADATRVSQSIEALTVTNPQCAITIEGGFNRPPMELTPRNLRLWDCAETLAEQLGIALDRSEVGGGSDANTTSQHAATLDGLGAVGHGAHADDEQAVIDAMPERAALLAGLLASPLGARG